MNGSGGRSIWRVLGYGCMGCVGITAVGFLLLAVLIYPHAKDAAMVDTCMANAQAAGKGLLLYAENNNDLLPPPEHWMDAAETRFLKPAKCPTLKPSEYGFAMTDELRGKALSAVAHPDAAVVLFESDDLGRNVYGNPRSDAARPRHMMRNTVFLLSGTSTLRANNYP